jgi:uncharacterized membrane protein YphA (DoxX/SURF4 family)
MGKIIVLLVRILVGVLFIFSGLVKANDPLGLSFKMQEFFEIWGWHWAMPYTLYMAVLMNGFEIVTGFALLIGWRPKLILWLLLALIIFFTILTGYTYYTGMPKNCGCFGDCLPITSQVSFFKDVFLLLAIILLIWKNKFITNLLSKKTGYNLVFIISLFSILFQVYTLDRLPIVDCLPYKVGNNIEEKMKIPANAIPDSIAIEFTYKVNGKLVSFTASQFPADFSADTYQFVSRNDKLIKKGSNNEPPIKGFVLNDNQGSDHTLEVLSQEKILLFFIEKFSQAGNFKDRFQKVYTAAAESNIPCVLITAEPSKAPGVLKENGLPLLPIYTADIKAIQTAARSNPTVFLLKKGTIVAKYGGTGITSIIDHLEP